MDRLPLEHVPRVFITLPQARDSVKAAVNGFRGQLRVALSDGIFPSRFSSFLALCRQEEQEVEIRPHPDDFPPDMFFTLLDLGITGIGAHHVLFTMQQFVRLGDVRDICRRDYNTVYQTRLVIALLGLMHFRGTLAVLIVG